MKRLADKVAVIYSDGTVGGAIAKAFAREGAKIYLAGRTRKKLDSIAEAIRSAGGKVETDQVDLLDEKGVEAHMDKLLRAEGKIDISFNGIGLPQKGIQGISLIELSPDAFSLPIATYTRSHFITARAAMKHMIRKEHGVILMHTPNASRISPPFVGGMVPAWAGIEALCRSISVEYGDKGIRAVCLFTTGIPETPLIDEVWEIQGKAHGITYEEFHRKMEGDTHRKKLTTLKELTDAAVFVASDEGAAISGTIFNLTAGMIV